MHSGAHPCKITINTDIQDPINQKSLSHKVIINFGQYSVMKCIDCFLLVAVTQAEPAPSFPGQQKKVMCQLHGTSAYGMLQYQHKYHNHNKHPFHTSPSTCILSCA